jgi:hypothetical protein
VIWNAIKSQICTAPPDPHHEAYLTRVPIAFVVNGQPENRYWVIGPYQGLKKLARDLRVDPSARARFGAACYGRRQTDLPPTGAPPSGGFRRAMETAIPHAVNQALIAQRADPADPAPRRSDLYDVFAAFYAAKTLEAHHIVEKSILAALKRNRGDLGDEIAPCVLVTAELHQQIYTPEVSQFRASFMPGMSSAEQGRLLRRIYGGREDAAAPAVPPGLYAPPQMADLWGIARIIIDQVALGHPR